MMSLDNKILLIYLLSSKICCIGLSWFTTQSPTETGPPSLDTKSERWFPGRNRGRVGKSKASGSIKVEGERGERRSVYIRLKHASCFIGWTEQLSSLNAFQPACASTYWWTQVLRNRKLDCMIYEMLFIRNKKPSLNTQSDSIRAPICLITLLTAYIILLNRFFLVTW